MSFALVSARGEAGIGVLQGVPRLIALVGCALVLAGGLIAASCGNEDQPGPSVASPQRAEDDRLDQEGSQPQQQQSRQQDQSEPVTRDRQQVQQQQAASESQRRSDASSDDQQVQDGSEPQVQEIKLTV